MKELDIITNVPGGREIPPLFELEESDISEILAPRNSDSHKGTYGYIGLVGGSLNYSGAIRLASMANCAMRSGAGVVKVALPKSLAYLILPDVLDATVFPLSDTDGMIEFDENEFEVLIKGLSVIAFGMGTGQSRDISKALVYLLTHFTGTLIIDADGLNELSHINSNILTDATCNVILTPHPKEFSRISGIEISEIRLSPIDSAATYAKKHNCTVLLKGNESIITDGSKAIINKRGCAGMATAGSGDVLSGVMAAVFGWGHEKYDNVTLAAAAAYIAGLAGEKAQAESCDISMTASDTARCIAAVISDIQNN